MYYRVLKNPLIVELFQNPNRVKSLNGTQLQEANFNLKLINRLKSTLDLADVSEANFAHAVQFFKSRGNKKADIFAKHIGAKSSEEEGAFYQITLSEEFNLNGLKKFLLYLPDSNVKSIEREVTKLNDKVFVIADETEQNAVAKLARDKTNPIIAPTVAELSELMLSYDVEQKFIKILSQCLSFKDVSPYQTKGDLKSESNFFGRMEILREIISNDSVNYLLVGARQLGKSSIFNALKRRYANSSKVKCYVLTLKNEDVLEEIALLLGLKSDATIEAIERAIMAHNTKPIFLIDEADVFAKNEIKSGYRITSFFRKLSQENKASFILAGFWTLYEHVILDYQSPLKNFGKLIPLSALEEEACKELMLQPMKSIGIVYENEAMVEKTIELCGYRGNYIATVCDTILRNLKTNVITQKDMDLALNSEVVYDIVNREWGRLSADKRKNRLDRLIVYLTITIEKDSFRLGDVVKGLEEKGLNIDIEEVTESLDRLHLGYVLGKHKGNYNYQIPLMKQQLLEDDLSNLIEGDVKGLRC